MGDNLRSAIEQLTAVIAKRDRRVSTRLDVNDDAWTFVEGQSEAVNCIVKDISDTGARIVFVGESRVLPKHFRMYIPEKQLMAHCEQVWQKGNEAGLKFIGLPSIG